MSEQNVRNQTGYEWPPGSKPRFLDSDFHRQPINHTHSATSSNNCNRKCQSRKSNLYKHPIKSNCTSIQTFNGRRQLALQDTNGSNIQSGFEWPSGYKPRFLDSDGYEGMPTNQSGTG